MTALKGNYFKRKTNNPYPTFLTWHAHISILWALPISLLPPPPLPAHPLFSFSPCSSLLLSHLLFSLSLYMSYGKETETRRCEEFPSLSLFQRAVLCTQGLCLNKFLRSRSCYGTSVTHTYGYPYIVYTYKLFIICHLQGVTFINI